MATYWENSCSFGLRYVSWYKYLIVSLVFSHLGFWSGNLFLIAPFPDLCLLVPFFLLRHLYIRPFIKVSYSNLGNFTQSKIECGIKSLDIMLLRDYHKQITSLIKLSCCFLSFDDINNIYIL